MSGQKQIPSNYPHILVNEAVPVPFDAVASFGVGGVSWQMKVQQPIFITRMLNQKDLETIHLEDKDPQSVGGDYVNWCRTIRISIPAFQHAVVMRVIRAGDLALGTEEIFCCDHSFHLQALRVQGAGSMVEHDLRSMNVQLAAVGCCELGNSEVEFIVRVLSKVTRK